MTEAAASTGFSWRPLGGNGPDWSANGHLYQSGGTRILVDLGAIVVGGDAGAGPRLSLPDARPWLSREDGPPNPEAAAALLVTHPHEDHCGAIVQYLKAGWRLPPIYGSAFGLASIRARLDGAGIAETRRPELRLLDPDHPLDLGGLTAQAVWVSHSVPQAMAFALSDGTRTILHSGDVKLDPSVALGPPTDLAALERLGRGGVDLMVLDATKAASPGLAPQEAEIRAGLAAVLKAQPDRRMVVGAFGGYQELAVDVLVAAAAAGRTVIVEDAEMVGHLTAIRQAGIDLDARVARLAGRPLRMVEGGSAAARALAPAGTVVLASGLQGERTGTLRRAAEGGHPDLAIGAEDVVVLTGGPLPGAEAEAAQLRRVLAATGARVIEGGGDSGLKVKAFGHGFREDLAALIRLVSPREVAPTHGDGPRLEALAQLATACGVGARLVTTGAVHDLAGGTGTAPAAARQIIIEDSRAARPRWILPEAAAPRRPRPAGLQAGR